MKRRFTILTAALALLTFLAVPMGMWGQSTVTFDATTDITANASSYQTTELTIHAADGSTWTANGYGATANTNIIIGKGGANYLRTPVIDGTITSVTVTWSGNTNYYLALQTTTGTELEAKSNPSTSTTETFNVSGSYNQLQLVGRRSSGTSNAAATITLVVVTYTTSSTPTPSMSVSTNSIDFGSNAINPVNPYTETFEVTFANLTENLTITGFTGVSVSPSTINYNATSPQTVTVSYNPTAEGSISGNVSVNSSEVNEQLVAVTGSAYDPSNVVTYERYTGTLVEGDYIICANEEVAMKNVISSNRFANEAVTVTGGKITNPDASIIWHIAPNGDHWTIYNAAVNKYAAGTSSNNQGTLLDAVTDNARWDITYQYSNYTVICYGRNSSSNKYLRRNGTYGWGTYANNTGNVPTFYKKVVTNQVATPSFSPAAGTFYEAQSVTLSCDTDAAIIYYTTDGTTPSTSNGTEYTTAISVSNTMTIKAIAVKDGMADSDVATAEYTIELPLTTMDQIFAKATEVGNTATEVRITFNNWVVTGANDSSHTFVTDGTKGFMIYQSNHGFAAGDILSGTVQCRVQLYNGAAEITNLTSSTTGLSVTPGGTVTVANIAMADLAAINTGALVSYQNLTCSVITGSYTNYYLTDGNTQIQVYSTLYSDLDDSLEDGKTYNITGVFVQNNSTKRVNPRSAADIVEVVIPYITVESDSFELTANEEEGYLEFTYDYFAPTSFDVMFCNANGDALSEDPDWITLAIEAPAGETGDFVYYYAEPNNGAARTAHFMVYAGDVQSNIVTVTQAAYEYPNYTWDLSTNSYAAASTEQVSWTSSFATMVVDKDESTTAANNYLGGTNSRTSTRFYTNSILTLSPVSGYVITSVVFTATTANYASALGSSTWTNATASVDGMVVTVTPTDGSIDMSATIGGTCGFTQVKVYYSFLLTITGYSGEKDHYYLIASPVTVDPATAGMTTGDFDLYYFDQAEEDEWRNYEATAFNLVPGKGYLYAKEAIDLNQTYSFVLTGIPYAGTGTVSLDYTENAEFPGFNLIGNPFGTNANLDLPFYRLNQDGSALNTTTEQSQINVMEGVFVQATAATRTANFTQATGAKRISQLNVKVTRNRSAVLDNAIIRFDDGATLGKFQLNQDDTKVYFTEDNQDYAIVRSNNAGEMPVSFKAAENGNYTLSVEAENVEASYLHLIDNMTGADVDLLATPSYNFEARTTDYANRFRLVFNANGVNENTATASFAYFNGSSWTVSNMGEATLQVVDMMGRVVSTQAISGNTDINLNQAAGVYMLRLVNGENVMVQKVVVR